MVKDKKVLPHLSSYANDPERIEEQANRMAKEGWLLEKFGSLFSTYRRGKAGEYEYRVQVKEAGMDRLVYTAELAEFGIEEVGGVGGIDLVSSRIHDRADKFVSIPDIVRDCRRRWNGN